MKVNKERIVKRLEELASIGMKEDGLHCMALSQEENQAYELTRKYMEEAGLSVSVDEAGNLIGRREGTDPDAPAVMTGSHIDTVYGGGKYDGRLGVIAGIEVAQTMNEQNVRTRCPIEICAYRDEEGTRFIGGYSGAQHRSGRPRPTALEHKDKDGITVRQALAECGIDPDKVKEAAMPREKAKAHLELHIEQGAVLENKDIPVAVVTGICCQIRGEIVVTGQAAHAGTTPIPLRKDALCAAAEIILAIEDEAKKIPEAVATVGRIAAFPGGVNVVPGEARFSIDMRHIDPVVRDRLFDNVNARAMELASKRGCECVVNVMSRQSTPMPCDDAVMDVIAEACGELSVKAFRIPSGAGHDSSAFIPFCPSGMIFVRSKDGLSHNKDEYSSPEDCAIGTEVLYKAMLKLAEPA